MDADAKEGTSEKKVTKFVMMMIRLAKMLDERAWLSPKGRGFPRKGGPSLRNDVFRNVDSNTTSNITVLMKFYFGSKTS